MCSSICVRFPPADIRLFRLGVSGSRVSGSQVSGSRISGLRVLLASAEGCASFGKRASKAFLEGNWLLRRKGGSKKVLRRGFLEGAFLACAHLV